MSKNINENKKYNSELKIKAVKMYLEEGKPCKEVAEELGIKCVSIIYKWIDTYKTQGEEGLKSLNYKSANRKRYKLETKIKAINMISNEGKSYKEVTKKLGTNYNTLREWISRYELDGENGLKSKQKNKKYSLELKLKAVKMHLKENKTYKEISKELNIDSLSVLTGWVSKYKLYGKEGLITKRGNYRYDPLLKEKAIKTYLAGGKTYAEVAEEIGVTSPDSISKWVNSYRKEGIESLDPRKRKGKKLGSKVNKRANYSLEIKEKAVKMYLEEGKGFNAIASELKINNSRTIAGWVNTYKIHGIEGLTTKKKNKKYPQKFKLMAVNMYLKGNETQEEIANKLNIRNKSSIRSWVAIYRKEGPEGLKEKNKKTRYPYDLKMKAVKMRIEDGVTYEEIRKELGIKSETSIMGWVEIFSTKGADGLKTK